MLDETASEQEILDWLESEYTAPFSGWDFGYLDSRWLELGEHFFNSNKLNHAIVSDGSGGALLAW